jgi:hypothetical protein
LGKPKKSLDRARDGVDPNGRGEFFNRSTSILIAAAGFALELP